MANTNILLTQNGVKDAVGLSFQADIPLFIYGGAGSGKSEIVKAVAEQYGLKLIDVRLSQLSQFDLLGYPESDGAKMHYRPLNMFPLETDPVPTGYKGFCVFLDEFNSADKYVQGASYKLLLDRMVGDFKLHPNVRFICAGNRTEDQGLVNKVLGPIKSRVFHAEMQIDTKEFLEYVFNQTQAGKWHPYIYAFLNFLPENISNYDPKNTDAVTYATPRTWEFLSKQLNAGLLSFDADTYTPIICGTVGEAAGMDFVGFLESFKEFPTLAEIEQDPEHASMPTSMGAKWALGIYLSNNMRVTNPVTQTQGNEQALIKYATRITEADLRVVIYRYLVMKNPALMADPTIQAALLQTQRLIAGI